MILPRLRSLALGLAAFASLGMARPPATPPEKAATPPPAKSAAAPPVAFAPPPPALEIPADSRPFTNAPAAAGIKIDHGYEEEDAAFSRSTELSILFPEAMVAPDRIDAEDAPSPLVIWPELNARWVWRTQSQGSWSVDGPLIPGQKYRLRLREGLADLAGTALPVADWGAELATAPLELTVDYEERDALSAQPQVPLEFNFPIRLHDAAEGCWFQDRATRQRFPAEVLLNRAASEVTGDVVDIAVAAGQPAPNEFRVRPRAPLPVGGRYDLIVENVRDAHAGRTLRYPEVIPLGRTEPLAVDFVAARNWTTDKPHIEVKFSTFLGEETLPANALTIDPAVKNLRFRKEGESLLADGDFDPAQRYKVTVSPDIMGSRGYPLAKSVTWGATFRPKKAALQFPEGLIRQRSALGLRFALLQANTGAVTWRLARIPLERLEAVRLATKENETPQLDALGLEIVGQGEIAASGDDLEVMRAIEWRPAAGARPLSGPYLMEASARTEDGATISNDALVFFNEAVFTQKTMPGGTALRLARMADGQPLAGIPVKLVTATLAEIARATTDDFGVVTFPAAALAGAAFFVAETASAPSVEPASPGASFPDTGSSYAATPPPFRGTVITDRPLYRPGEEVKFKGFLRINDAPLGIPTGTPISWQVVNTDRNERIADGTANVNAFGGWDGAWIVPPQGKLGGFKITTQIGKTEAGEAGNFRVEEFRNPAFSVVCEPVKNPKAAESTIQVASQYFHGAPNVGSTVKWTVTWLSDSDGEYYSDGGEDGFLRVDLYSEHRRTPAFDAEVSGEAVLDARGQITLTCAAPFKDPGLRANCEVSWQVDITGPDGQTITGGASERVVMNDVTLGVRADGESGTKDIAFDLEAIRRATDEPATGEVQAGLFLVQTKSVKERLAPFVYRYRNTDEFIPVEQRTVPANGRMAFTPKTPGRYVLVVAPLAGQPGIPVSAETYLSGEGDAELPVKNDQTLVVKSTAGDKPVPVGATAGFDVLSPSPGIAWVTVETDRVLDAYTIPLPGNSTRIEVPVKPGYAPNVHVSIYLLRPGGADTLPAEMYGSTELAVTQPGAELALEVTANRPEYEPRNAGTITVRATADGRAVPNAEITLYAVDDAILTLGDWALPKLLATFLVDHPFTVVTRLALSGYVEGFREKALTQKGFIVGGGGKDEFGNTQFVRQDLRPLILWLPSLRTGPDGVATADFETPDNLTRFRVIALGQTRESQFGAGDTTFNVSKPLLVEPALPRFLRQGDEVELRAVARQKFSAEERLTIRCEPSEGLTLLGPASVERKAAKNEPAVATFRARVAGNATSAAVRFAVSSAAGPGDSVETTLPVAARTIEVRESLAGTSSDPTFAPAKITPAAWLTTPGHVDVTLSTSPDLPKLLGIPAVLDYPYGCFEQKSSRLLVYTALARLLAFLPQPDDRNANYRRVIEQLLEEFEKSLLGDDLVPYWPYGTEGNAFVTIQTAWAVAMAGKAGYHVPEALAAALPRALEQIILRKSRLEVEPSLRAFALFGLSQLGEEPSEEVTAAANELFLGRERLTDEGRAFLAIAMHRFGFDAGQAPEIIRELPATFDDRAFNPRTFSSTDRAEAICTLARLLITPDADLTAFTQRLREQMSTASSLSTQENLWLLMAFNALAEAKPPARLPASAHPKPDALSANRSAATWLARDLATLRDLTITNLQSAKPTPLTYLVAARRNLGPAEQTAVGKGLRIERIVKNLSSPARLGTAAAPFKLGDQVLISFRFHCDQTQNYVAVEDALPAGLEVVNPNLEMIGKFYQIPDEPGVPTAWLSFSEMRDRQTNLFFDTLTAGPQSYAILARATAAGTFAWPSTQITPMYDARFYARTAPSQCVVTE